MRRLVVLLAVAGMLLAACGSTGRHLWLTRPVTFTACADSPCGHYAVTLHWASVSGATDYPVLVNGVQKADPTSAPYTLYTLYGLACGTTYTLEIEAHGSSTSVIGTTRYTAPACVVCPVSTANVPDGPDPWGGCFPGPDNTGVPAGTTLTTVAANSSGAGWSADASGNITVTACGVTFNAAKITGDFTINDNVNNGYQDAAHPCVTLENSEIDGTVMVSNNDGTGNSGPLVMTDDLVNVPNTATNLAHGSPVMSANYFATGVNVEGGRLGFACQGTCSITDSYAHAGFMACSGTFGSTCNSNGGYHYDVWGSNGIWWESLAYAFPTSAGVTMTHDTWSCDFTNTSTTYGQLAVNNGAGCSAIVGMHSDFGPSNNITFTKNLVVADTTAVTASVPNDMPYCIDMSNPNTGKYYPFATNITVNDNVFGRNTAVSPSSNCGYYGPDYSWTWGDGNSWSGNTYDDGTALNLTAGPTNTALPVITGTAAVGNTLTVSNGTWTGCGTGCTYTYMWLDCGAAGSQTVNCPAINSPEGGGTGETASSYTISSTDVTTLAARAYAAGDEIKAVVTACDSTGGCTDADAAAVS